MVCNFFDPGKIPGVFRGQFDAAVRVAHGDDLFEIQTVPRFEIIEVTSVHVAARTEERHGAEVFDKFFFHGDVQMQRRRFFPRRFFQRDGIPGEPVFFGPAGPADSLVFPFPFHPVRTFYGNGAFHSVGDIPSVQFQGNRGGKDFELSAFHAGGQSTAAEIITLHQESEGIAIDGNILERRQRPVRNSQFAVRPRFASRTDDFEGTFPEGRSGHIQNIYEKGIFPVFRQTVHRDLQRGFRTFFQLEFAYGNGIDPPLYPTVRQFLRTGKFDITEREIFFQRKIVFEAVFEDFGVPVKFIAILIADRNHGKFVPGRIRNAEF